MENTNKEINLLDYMKIIAKNKFVILAFIFLGVLFAFLVIYFTPKIYQAKAVISIGNMGKSSERLVVEINQSFSQTYPNLSAIVLSEGIIEINNHSIKKDESEKGISDVLSVISSADDEAKNIIQKRVNNLKIETDRLKSSGQQSPETYLRLFDAQEQLDSFIKTKIIQQSVNIKNTMNLFVLLSIGGILGFLIGLFFIFIREWWNKNKVIFYN